MWNRRLGILLVALSLGGAATLPASAQNPADDRNGVTTRTADDGFDLGWLGLIGLVGLLGMRRRDDSHSDVKGASRTM
ncbi:MAG TPA: WGxxGxxG family protein [Gammaproteobacteria bacterium]